MSELQKKVMTNILLGASTMAGIIAVSKITKVGAKYYMEKVQKEDTDEIGEVEELA